MTSSTEPRFEKYQEFQEKRAAIRKEQGIVSDFYMVEIAQKYYQLLGEVLEEYKKLENSLIVDENAKLKEWGYDDTEDFESDEERERWNSLMIKFTKKIRKKSMNKAISYLYREILLKVWEEILRKDRYKDYYQRYSELEEDVNSLEIDIQKIIDINFDEEFCEELYEEIDCHSFLCDTISDTKSDLSDDAVETGVRDDDYEYPSKELAIPITGLPDYFLGFTYYFGGGKYDDGDWKPDITETCYLLTCREEVKVVKVYLRTVDDYEKVTEEE